MAAHRQGRGHHRVASSLTAHTVELEQLRYFLRAVERASLTEAAADLRMAPATLNRQIARLEEELSTPLLLRAAKSILPTEAGLAFMREAQLTVRHAEHTPGASLACQPAAGGKDLFHPAETESRARSGQAQRPLRGPSKRSADPAHRVTWPSATPRRRMLPLTHQADSCRRDRLTGHADGGRRRRLGRIAATVVGDAPVRGCRAALRGGRRRCIFCLREVPHSLLQDTSLAASRGTRHRAAPATASWSAMSWPRSMGAGMRGYSFTLPRSCCHFVTSLSRKRL